VHSLPVFLRLTDRPVILVGEGDAANAKRRLLERAGAEIVGEDRDAALGIVAMDDPEPTVARLKARGILVNAVDRPDLCDFTLPAIVDRDPVLVAVGTGGASAGLAKALRQRLEALLPASLGALATALHAARPQLRERWPDAAQRRHSIDAALTEGGPLDPLGPAVDAETWLGAPDVVRPDEMIALRFASTDPDELTIREARLLGQADRIFHRYDVPPAILHRARADAERIPCPAPPAEPGSGLSLDLAMADG
jgi:uroporphyrin-III C-methyltransferase/precorrin-2 dehydrogenase/sirohydrochlorin ferrochelatase